MTPVMLLQMQGPYQLLQGYLGALLRVPVFVNASGLAANETFGAVHGPTNCSVCEQTSDGQRFWGVSCLELHSASRSCSIQLVSDPGALPCVMHAIMFCRLLHGLPHPALPCLA